MAMPAWITGGLAALGGKAVDAWSAYRERKHEERMIDVRGQQELKKLDYELKATERMAKIEITRQKVEHAMNWELASIRNSGWKDEYITIILTAPYILAFIPYPPLQVLVRDGFHVISATPAWYQTLIFGVVSSALGIRLWGSIKSINKTGAVYD